SDLARAPSGARGVFTRASASRTPHPAQVAGGDGGAGLVAAAPNLTLGGPQGASGERSDEPTSPGWYITRGRYSGKRRTHSLATRGRADKASPEARAVCCKE